MASNSVPGFEVVERDLLDAACLGVDDKPQAQLPPAALQESEHRHHRFEQPMKNMSARRYGRHEVEIGPAGRKRPQLVRTGAKVGGPVGRPGDGEKQAVLHHGPGPARDHGVLQAVDVQGGLQRRRQRHTKLQEGLGDGNAGGPGRQREILHRGPRDGPGFDRKKPAALQGRKGARRLIRKDVADGPQRELRFMDAPLVLQRNHGASACPPA